MRTKSQKRDDVRALLSPVSSGSLPAVPPEPRWKSRSAFGHWRSRRFSARWPSRSAELRSDRLGHAFRRDWLISKFTSNEGLPIISAPGTKNPTHAPWRFLNAERKFRACKQTAFWPAYLKPV